MVKDSVNTLKKNPFSEKSLVSNYSIFLRGGKGKEG